MKLVILMCLALVLVVGCKGMYIDSVKPVTEPVLESITNLTNQVDITNQICVVKTNDYKCATENHLKTSLIVAIGIFLGFIILGLVYKHRRHY